jgi:8-oxo-dGTP pyrophosphatase MutT (NUDIX family)
MSFAKNTVSTSYGIIVYTYVENELRFLMTLRRDTFCYECIIRGMYTEDVLEEYISHITKEERDRILQYDFEMLWKDLWVSTKRRLYRVEHRKAKDKYEYYKQRIHDCVSKMVHFDIEQWEFPKGKKFAEESPLQCAFREFEEETNLSHEQIILVKKAGTFEESFSGNDKRTYKSVYYLGLLHQNAVVPFNYQKCPYGMRNDYVSDEVMSIEWLSYENALHRSSPTKKNILQNVYHYLCG